MRGKTRMKTYIMYAKFVCQFLDGFFIFGPSRTQLRLSFKTQFILLLRVMGDNHLCQQSL